MRNLRIVVTDFCNLSCAYCYNEGNMKPQQENHSIDYKILHRTVAFLSKKFNDVVITGGEPLLHPQIISILQAFIDEGKIPRITTNGIKLDCLFDTPVYEKLKRFNISLDRFEAESFRLRTRTKCEDYEKIIKNIRTLVDHNKEVTLNMICDEYTTNSDLDHIFANIKNLGIKRVKFIPLIGCNENIVIKNIIDFLDNKYCGQYMLRGSELDINEYICDDMSVMIVHQYCNMKNCDRCREDSFYRLNYDGKIYRCLRDKNDYFNLFEKYEEESLENDYFLFESFRQIS